MVRTKFVKFQVPYIREKAVTKSEENFEGVTKFFPDKNFRRLFINFFYPRQKSLQDFQSFYTLFSKIYALNGKLEDFVFGYSFSKN